MQGWIQVLFRVFRIWPATRSVSSTISVWSWSQEIRIEKAPGEKLGISIRGGAKGHAGNPFDPTDEGIFISKVPDTNSALGCMQGLLGKRECLWNLMCSLHFSLGTSVLLEYSASTEGGHLFAFNLPCVSSLDFIFFSITWIHVSFLSPSILVAFPSAYLAFLLTKTCMVSLPCIQNIMNCSPFSCVTHCVILFPFLCEWQLVCMLIWHVPFPQEI